MTKRSSGGDDRAIPGILAGLAMLLILFGQSTFAVGDSETGRLGWWGAVLGFMVLPHKAGFWTYIILWFIGRHVRMIWPSRPNDPRDKPRVSADELA